MMLNVAIKWTKSFKSAHKICIIKSNYGLVFGFLMVNIPFKSKCFFVCVYEFKKKTTKIVIFQSVYDKISWGKHAFQSIFKYHLKTIPTLFSFFLPCRIHNTKMRSWFSGFIFKLFLFHKINILSTLWMVTSMNM